MGCNGRWLAASPVAWLTGPAARAREPLWMGRCRHVLYPSCCPSCCVADRAKAALLADGQPVEGMLQIHAADPAGLLRVMLHC